MCIAIYKPENKVISKVILEQCYKANPDGAGFMYVQNKELVMKKGFFTFDDFWNAWQPHETKQAAIHFRIKTHGKINEENCHPFMINKGLGFIHNGVIGGFGYEDKSDTYHFNEEIMKPLVSIYGNSILTNNAIKTLIESKIGYSKFVMIDRHGNHTLFNEDKGVWDSGIWYSNNSYKPVVYAPQPVQRSFNYKSALPVPQYNSKPKHKTLEIGDIVELITGVYDSDTKTFFKKGEFFEVVSINKDYTADLMHEDSDKFLYNISYAKFDIITKDYLDEEDLVPEAWEGLGYTHLWE